MSGTTRFTLNLQQVARKRISRYVIDNIGESSISNISAETSLDVTMLDRLLAFRDPPWYNECRAALQRLQDGIYGICFSCHRPISAVELESNPLSRFCLHCEEILNRHEEESHAELISETRKRQRGTRPKPSGRVSTPMRKEVMLVGK